MRALHLTIDGEPKILVDPVAERLLGDDALRSIIANIPAHGRGAPGLRSQVVTRSRYTEDNLEDAVRCGMAQYVILGAGFDTFAYRQPEWALPLRIFEVDHPSSQHAKREQLDAKQIFVPPNVVYVSGDFEHESLAGALRAGGFDFAKPAFFCALGLLVYLTMEAVQSLFAFVGSLAEHTEFVFTFSEPEEMLTPIEREGRRRLAAAAASAGEPWRTHFVVEQLISELQSSGFSRVEIPTADEIAQRYFDNVTSIPAPRRRFLARAIV